MFWLKETLGAVLFYVIAMAWILLVLCGIFIVWDIVPLILQLWPYSSF